MELAKIRNKGKQSSAKQPEQPTAGFEAAETTSLDELFENSVIPENLPVKLTVPVIQETSEPLRQPAKFCKPATDPLSVILAGRENDCRTEGEQVAQEEQPEMQFEEFLCFRLADEEYGINIMQIKEIIKFRELTEVPRTAPFIDGVISLRGVIVPVFNMRRRLGMTLAYERNQERILIVRSDDQLYGLRIDRVTDVVKVMDGKRETAPAILDGIGREFVDGIGRSGDRMIIILNIPNVINTAQWEAA